MNGGTDDVSDMAILIFDVSDEPLESAAGAMREKAGVFTLGSGFDTCPS